MVQSSTAAQDRIIPDYSYIQWMESIGVPIHRGHFIADLRTVDLEWWEERQCKSAFLQFHGQEGVSEARVTEIPPGATLPPMKFALDEMVYVVSGRGLATIEHQGGGSKRTFEWQDHSLFLIPGGHTHQFTNMRSDQPARLLNYNYLPVAMSAVPNPDFFFDNPFDGPDALAAGGDEFYSEAKAVLSPDNYGVERNYWQGNFFPDMQAWDKLDALKYRGAGGHSVQIRFPVSELTAHMSVFPSKTYKKAHRHGPGRVIVIPGGEGYSIIWEEGREKVIIPWQEASVFTPPEKWFHQHFNLGEAPARYLALHPMPQFRGHAEKVEDRARDQIEYPQEESFIREKFEGDLSDRGLSSVMPEEAYQEMDYEWAYSGTDEH